MHKLVNVLRVTELRPEDAVERELALVTVASPPERARRPARARRSRPARRSPTSADDAITFQIVGRPDDVDAFEELVRPYGIRELARTGRIGLRRTDHNGNNNGKEPNG